jgi:hypothetical protein
MPAARSICRRRVLTRATLGARLDGRLDGRPDCRLPSSVLLPPRSLRVALPPADLVDSRMPSTGLCSAGHAPSGRPSGKSVQGCSIVLADPCCAQVTVRRYAACGVRSARGCRECWSSLVKLALAPRGRCTTRVAHWTTRPRAEHSSEIRPSSHCCGVADRSFRDLDGHNLKELAKG